MYTCEVCNRQIFKKHHANNKVVCSKHMHQFRKYGKFLDNIQRTNADLNDFVINHKDGTVTFNVYNQRNLKVTEFTIDIEDLPKVRYHKWRLSNSHIKTGNLNRQRDLSHVILGITKEDCQSGKVVDHINGDTTDNRKCNLRVCTQSENLLNKSFMSNNTIGFIGISYRKCRNSYDPEIRYKYKRCHLGQTKSLEEAVYKRYYAEKILFKEFANKEEQEKKLLFCSNLSIEKKQELENIVINKLKAKNFGNKLL